MTKHKDYQKWVPGSVIAAVVVALIAGVVVAVQPFEDTGVGCKTAGKQYTMTVTDSAVTPAHTQTKRCDTLTIVNKSSGERRIMFGHPDEMETYDGVMQKDLPTGESFTVKLNVVGDFHFHEHTKLMSGTFSVQ